jgi:hypothetical protein
MRGSFESYLRISYAAFLASDILLYTQLHSYVPAKFFQNLPPKTKSKQIFAKTLASVLTCLFIDHIPYCTRVKKENRGMHIVGGILLPRSHRTIIVRQRPFFNSKAGPQNM